MPLENEMNRWIEEIEDVLSENFDIKDEIWWNNLKEIKDKLKDCLAKLDGGEGG